jgi:hypothetical protein
MALDQVATAEVDAAREQRLALAGHEDPRLRQRPKRGDQEADVRGSRAGWPASATTIASGSPASAAMPARTVLI